MATMTVIVQEVIICSDKMTSKIIMTPPVLSVWKHGHFYTVTFLTMVIFAVYHTVYVLTEYVLTLIIV